MKRLLSALLFLCFAIVANTSDAATTYVYAGPNYTSATGAYTTSMSITGSFTTASPLAANLTNAQIGPGGSNLVTQWSFDDGVQTLTNLDSVLLGGNPLFFSVSTDASGHITKFLIEIMNPAGTNTVGQAMNAIGILSDSPYQIAVVSGPCASTSGGKCSSVYAGANVAIGGLTSGTFAVATATASASMLAPPFLALLALALLAVAYRVRPDQV